MSASIHRFTIGRFQCAIVPDGTNAYPHPAVLFFGSAPPDELARALQMHQINPCFRPAPVERAACGRTALPPQPRRHRKDAQNLCV
jgi:hypothetical protein